MDKTQQIFYRFKHDQKNLKVECVDLLSKCYLMLGQKPDTQQVVLMAQMLYNDLVQGYGGLTMEKVGYIFTEGIKHSENGGFVNVRNWNIWLKEFKFNGKMQQNYEKQLEWNDINNEYLIGNTINKAKKIR